MQRSQRANRGNRLQKVLNEELEDEEIYKDLYGGFEEVSDDEQYSTEDDEEDIVDSDFDETNDEPEEGEEKEGDEDEDKPRKRARLIPEPKKPKKDILKSKPKAQPNKRKTTPAAITAVSTSSDAQQSSSSLSSSSSSPSASTSTTVSTSTPSSIRKSVRSNVIEHSSNTAKRVQEREEKKSRSIRPKREPFVKMTQEELLEEAKRTEEINLATLDQYLKMEEEKKKNKTSSVVLTGPRCVFQSVTIVDPQTQERFCQNFVSFSE